ncbi:kinase-like domain-containing protein [Lobosporangium transversale]|uniref:Kinase-like domain-containing protein n=1 Tax=Lobosporangium transversale TaxID=64571 RepID=A0A1Y2G8S8_9FUNG|nr:kinase-like domain-containing protein [Lobosporangium transversale]ORZ04400.1 kinase-like domain-containing protein [Lobosporangium transversale]|eukprot:XP_021876508.1 kinase-like domain-containing protein [Lobosporangium transversale]
MGNGMSRDPDDIFDNEVNLFHFKLLRVIGKGSFGKVRMVERRETGKLYALKYISKAQVIKMDAVRNIIRERQILESVDHAFVVNMRFAFQDDEYMYMCMDLMMGGDLRFHMNRRTFGEDVVRFWIAEISCAISHLHELGIVHRDIKPDNILLDEKGHAHITDFNIGCKLTPEKPVLHSQSGTVAYMAPEFFKGKGYGTSVDWWALGIIFYECIYNQRPFVTENIGELKRAISSQTIEYPVKSTISRECVSAIQGFLTRDPAERLGAMGGMDGIRYQPFFLAAAQEAHMNIDEWWYMLERKQLTPIFQPPAEAANFDATYDLEELLLDEDPLTYRSTRKRAQRLHREREQALRDENARLKAEHEAAARAALEAEAAMEAMNKKLEEGIRKARLSSSSYSGAFATNTSNAASPPSSQQRATLPAVAKKRSILHLFGSDSHNVNKGCSENGETGQTTSLQTQSPPIPQPQPQSHHTISQLARQTQFQSIPLSPIDPPNGSREFQTPPIPALRFPPSPPPCHYTSLPVASEIRNVPISQRSLDTNNSLDHHPSSYYRRSPPNPPRPDSFSIVKGSNGEKNGTTGLTGDKQQEPQELYASTAATSAAIVVSQHPFQAAHPQKAITSPVIIPTPLDHSVSRHKHIPLQQSQPQPLPQAPHLRQQSSHQQLQPRIGGGLRRPLSPTPAAMNIAAAAAAATLLADMSEEERFDYMMDLIDREFTTFDYTVYESYHGLVDPVTMSVGNPPEWVRSRD